MSSACDELAEECRGFRNIDECVKAKKLWPLQEQCWNEMMKNFEEATPYYND